MLQADAGSVRRVEHVGHIAGGIDAGHTGDQVFVGDDAVVQPESRGLGQLGAWLDPDADHDRPGRKDGAVAQADLFDPVGSADRVDAHSEVQSHAMFGVQVAIDAADLASEYPLERHRRHLDHRHFGPQLARRSRHLAPDPTRPDHDHRPFSGDGLAQGVGVGDGAEIEDTGQGRPQGPSSVSVRPRCRGAAGRRSAVLRGRVPLLRRSGRWR